MTLQQSTFHIPRFDCRNPPLREFLQDVSNGAVFITPANEPGFMNLLAVGKFQYKSNAYKMQNLYIKSLDISGRVPDPTAGRYYAT